MLEKKLIPQKKILSAIKKASWLNDTQYEMLLEIARSHKAIIQSIYDVGGRSQTDFMFETMVCGDEPTAIGKANQTLKEIERIVFIFKDNLKRVDADLEKFPDDERYLIMGAIKTWKKLTQLHNKFLKEAGIEKLTNEIVENHEPERHLKIMFKHAVWDYISRAGHIDKGTCMYGDSCELDPSQVITEVNKYYIEDGKPKVRTKTEQRAWLDQMWEKYKFLWPSNSRPEQK